MLLERERVLAWRLGRHALDPVDGIVAVDVVRRVVAVRGWPADMTELAVGVRQAEPRPNDVARALDNGVLIRSYAMRGGSYVFTPDDAAELLAVRTTSRAWANARYQQQAHFALDDWEPFRDAVCTFLADGPKTRDEIAAHVGGLPTLRHLTEAATGIGSDALYKPLHWWGDICFGHPRGSQATFRLLRDDPAWPGMPDVDTAGRRAILRYLGAYGPATAANLSYWVVEGLSAPRRLVQRWLAELVADGVTTLDLDGQEVWACTADLDELSSAEPSASVRFLPGYDPWVLGPGTADPLVTPPERRALASRGTNLVVADGVVSGTWQVRGPELSVTWFPEAGPAPERALEAEGRRLTRIVGGELRLRLSWRRE